MWTYRIPRSRELEEYVGAASDAAERELPFRALCDDATKTLRADENIVVREFVYPDLHLPRVLHLARAIRADMAAVRGGEASLAGSEVDTVIRGAAGTVDRYVQGDPENLIGLAAGYSDPSLVELLLLDTCGGRDVKGSTESRSAALSYLTARCDAESNEEMVRRITSTNGPERTAATRLLLALFAAAIDNDLSSLPRELRAELPVTLGLSYQLDVVRAYSAISFLNAADEGIMHFDTRLHLFRSRRY